MDVALLFLFILFQPSHGFLWSSSTRTSTRLFSEDFEVGEVKIDDGGSDLTDRFKYKVNALMGVFDPQDGSDDDRQNGNILNAMLNFPTRYTCNIVGKTSGDDSIRDEYVENIKEIVYKVSGDEEIRCKVTPRGKNFTKIQCEAEVQSAMMITAIYDDISKLAQTAMRF